MTDDERAVKIANANAGGDEAARAAFVKATLDKLRSIVERNMPRDQNGMGGVTDIVQSAYRHFLSYCEKTESEIRDHEALLIHNAKWCVMRRLRAIRIQKRDYGGSVPLDAIPDAGPSPSSSTVHSEDLIRLERSLARLPAEDRALLLRRESSTDTWDQIAAEVGKSSRTLKRRHRRLVELLRAELAGDE